MAALLYHIFSFAALFTYGLYHLVSACRAQLKSSPHRDYAAQPYHPLPLPSHAHQFLRHLPIHLVLLALVIAAVHQAAVATSAEPIPRLAALQSFCVILLFLLLAASLLLAHCRPHLFPLPPDLSFLLAALAFGLRSAASARYAASYHPSDDLPARCEAITSMVTAVSSAICLSLAVFPRLFLAEFALAASVSLQGIWSLQTGLSLFTEAFIPEGCHRLLDVPGGNESSARCELDESRQRAAAVLDLALAMHATFIALVAVLIYIAVARASGSARNLASYESLPTVSSGGALNDMDHVQMKAIGKSTMQA